MSLIESKNSYGIQVVFSTIPHHEVSDEYSFESDLEKHYFDDYRKDIKSESFPFLYQPIKYYLFGDFDVVYISLINNFKFSHRLFEPKSKDNKKNIVYNAHTFQSYSGFALNDHNYLKDIFTPKYDEEKNKIPLSYFIGVINLKLNNGIYIGNGEKYINAIHRYIDFLFKDFQYVINQTFAWFEISLIVFIDSPNTLSDKLLELRLSKLSDLLECDNFEEDELNILIQNSLYKELNGKSEKIKDKIKNVSLFADTNSHFGVNERLIKGNYDTMPKDLYVKNFIDNIAENINLETEIEWQVKPNHINRLITTLSNHKYLGKSFKTSIKDTNIVLGKCDYLIQECKDNILSNLHMMRYMNQKRSNKCDVFDHIRKVRTYVFLNSNEDILNLKNNKDVIKGLVWEPFLRNLAVKSLVFAEVENQLKALKVSRQIRIKILKIFSNYNNGIQDPIQFPYFLDFWIFIKNLIKKIDAIYLSSKEESYNLRGIEKDLNIIIQEFEEGFEVRFLNGYQFENISDFDLDFNNSIQQLLTSYGTMIYEFGKLYYESNYYPIIQLNNIDTVSNYESIHYFGHHLTSPEFIFASVTKEILNHLEYGDKVHKQLIEEFEQGYLTKLKVEINESYFDDMIDAEMVDLNYFAIDAIRYRTSFDSDFELFEHWFWLYHFQNSYNFNTNGTFNEQRLKMEMFRLLLIYFSFVKNSVRKDLKCPSSEIYNAWDRHYDKIKIIVMKIVEYSRSNEDNGLLHKIFLNVEHIYDSTKKISKLSLPIREMEMIGYKILSTHAEKNNNKITSLKRDWITGEPLKEYKELYKDIFYAPDQTGGSFFYDCNKMQDYFNDNVINLKSIINFSAINKKDFIVEQIKQK